MTKSTFQIGFVTAFYIFLTKSALKDKEACDALKNKIDKNDDTEELQLKGVVRAGCDWRTGWEQGLTILMYYEFMPTEKHL